MSSDAVALMEFATELFVGLLTALAWQIATMPAKRHTLGLADLSSAVACRNPNPNPNPTPNPYPYPYP